MNYQTLKQNPSQFLALTSLLPDEFETLLAQFTPHWERYYRYRTLEGTYRRQPAYQERANAVLQGTSTKLLFLLTYLKTNSLQQQQAASFGISQTKVSRMAAILLEVLNQTLAHMALLPIRNGEELADRLGEHAHQVFTYDGIERGILRHTDPQVQREQYSAKKKPID